MGQSRGDAAGAVDSRRLALVVQSVENLTHDLNNVIMSLGNYAELSGLETVDQATRTRHAQRMSELVRAAAVTVKSLRGVATVGDGTSGPVAFEQLLAPVIEASTTGLRHAGLALDVVGHPRDTRVIASADDGVLAMLDLVDLGRHLHVGVARTSSGPRGLRLDVAVEPSGPSEGPEVRVALRLAAGALEADPASLDRLTMLAELVRRAGGELDVRRAHEPSEPDEVCVRFRVVGAGPEARR